MQWGSPRHPWLPPFAQTNEAAKMNIYYKHLWRCTLNTHTRVLSSWATLPRFSLSRALLAGIVPAQLITWQLMLKVWRYTSTKRAALQCLRHRNENCVIFVVACHCITYNGHCSITASVMTNPDHYSSVMPRIIKGVLSNLNRLAQNVPLHASLAANNLIF